MNDVAVNILRGVKDKKGNTALIHAVSNDSDPKIISALKTDTDINAGERERRNGIDDSSKRRS